MIEVSNNKMPIGKNYWFKYENESKEGGIRRPPSSIEINVAETVAHHSIDYASHGAVLEKLRGIISIRDAFELAYPNGDSRRVALVDESPL